MYPTTGIRKRRSYPWHSGWRLVLDAKWVGFVLKVTQHVMYSSAYYPSLIRMLLQGNIFGWIYYLNMYGAIPLWGDFTWGNLAWEDFSSGRFC